MNDKTLLKTTLLFFLLFALAIGGAGCGGESEHDVHEKDSIAEIASDTDTIIIPGTYDLRKFDRVTSVKRQGAVETCWAFAAMGAMESNYLTQGLNTPECGKTPDLSAMHHAWFVYKDPEVGHSFPYSSGRENEDVLKQGGNCLKSIAFLSRLTGPVNEDSLKYPNILQLEDLSYEKPSGSPTDYKRVLRLKEAYVFSPKNENNEYRAPETNENTMDIIKRIIMQHGAVEITYHYRPEPQSDFEFIVEKLRGREYYFEDSDKDDVNHRVLIIGWDDNKSKSKFKSSNGREPDHDGAWFIKDSHGTLFSSNGIDGYFWMSYEQVIKLAAAYIVEPLDENLIHYGWDDLGYTEKLRTVSEPQKPHWVANVFQAQNNELIKEVGFYTLEHRTQAHGSTYEVFIYDLGTEKPASPTDGNIIAQIHNQNYEIRGYHSVALDTPVRVDAGHYFSIMLKVTAPKCSHPIAAEDASSGALIHKGESYASSNGYEWNDLGDRDDEENCNVCLKAFTTPIIDSDDENNNPIDIGDYEVVTSTNTQWTAPNIYAVTNNVTISERIKVSGGNVQLVLCDGCTLNAEKGIEVSDGSLLVIRGQSQNTGTLKATSYNSYAAIGGSGNITILGGTINAESKGTGAGIGGDDYGSKTGTVIIIGGNITAKSTKGGAGIGTGETANNVGKVIIKGGRIVAGRDGTGVLDRRGRGIGGGYYSNCDITLYGGSITAINGIGAGEISRGGWLGKLAIEGEVEYFSGQHYNVYYLPEDITCKYHLFKNGKCVWCGEISEEKIEINASYFPDQNFRNYVSTTFDTNKDGYLSVDEITRITELDISNKNISNVKGIEYFTALTKFICDNNQIKELDTSNNKQLCYLSCRNNLLTSLVLGQNINLESLICEQNRLKGVDISGCPNLKDFGHDDWNTSSTQYTISYILNGGINNSDNPHFYTQESETITLKAPIKDGYIFNGWTYNGQLITQINKGSTGDLTLTATWEVNQHNSHPEVATIEIAVLERGLQTPASNYSGLLSQVIQDQYKDDSATPLNEKDISKISASLFSKTGFTADGNTRLMLRVQTDRPGTVNFYIPEFGAVIENISRSSQSSSSVTVTAVKVDDNIYQATAILTAPSDYPAGMNFPSANFDISVKFQADDHTTSEKKITLSINATPVVFIHGIFGESASAFGKGENKGIWHILNEAGVKTYFWNYDNYRGPTDVIKEGLVSDLYKKLIAIFGEYNSKGIACTRADLIGHSMGGLMARRFTIADYGNKIGHVSYAQGAVRRIITVATPHRGSPWATHVLRNEAFKEFCEKLLGSGKDASSAWYDLYEPNSLKIGYNASVPIYSLCGNIRDFISSVADKVMTYTGGTRAVLGSLLSKSYEDIAFIILASLIIKKQDRDRINNLTSDLENLINDNIFSGNEHDTSVSVPSATLDFTESYSKKYNGINYNHMTICKQDDVGRDVLNLLKGPKYNFKLFEANTASGASLASPQYQKKQISVSAIDDTDIDTNFEMLEKINLTLEPSTLKLTNGSSGNVTLNALPSDEISNEVFVIIQNSDGNRIFAISPEANNNNFSVTMEFTNEVSGILNVFCFAAGKDGNLYVSGKKQLTILPTLGNISRLEFLDSTGTIFTRVNSDIPVGVYAITNDGKTYDVSSPLMGTEFNIGDADKISITNSGYIRAIKAGKTSLSAKFSGFTISTNIEISEETGDIDVPYTDNYEYGSGNETENTNVPYIDYNTNENREYEKNYDQENNKDTGDTETYYPNEGTNEDATSGGGGCHINFEYGIVVLVLLNLPSLKVNIFKK